jgi:ABC-type sulfate transport system permease component
MATGDPSHGSAEHRDYSALVILAILGLLEIVILYVLIAVDTPVTPMVRRLLENPAGVFTLVMCVVTLLCFGMAGFLSWAERHHGKTMRGSAPPMGAPTPEQRD